MCFLSKWTISIAQITELTIDTTVIVNTTGSQLIESDNYLGKLEYLTEDVDEDITDEELSIQFFSFNGHGDSVYNSTQNSDFDTYLLIYKNW